MSARAWISWITLVVIVVILILSRHELLHAWELLGSVNLGILALLLPLQLIAYYSAGETMFSYLRAKQSIPTLSKIDQAKMALEMNFVNHALPSAGVSGLSYMTWRLGHYGISAGRATVSQVVRFVVGFAAAIVLILISVVVVTIDGSINRWIILVSAALVTFMTTGTLLMMYLVSNEKRITRFSKWLTQFINRLVRRLTRGRKRTAVREEGLLRYFTEMHRDYDSLSKDVRILIRPFLWALLFTIVDALLFWITFVALGEVVNPAPILIAYVLASVAAFIVVTPGGAGAYEAIMVAFLSVAGIASGVAIAGIVLTRVIMLLTTILLGYVF
jgi:uncharacterized protein (TIRG00374 family)